MRGAKGSHGHLLFDCLPPTANRQPTANHQPPRAQLEKMLEGGNRLDSEMVRAFNTATRRELNHAAHMAGSVAAPWGHIAAQPRDLLGDEVLPPGPAAAGDGGGAGPLAAGEGGTGEGRVCAMCRGATGWVRAAGG